MAFNFTLVSQCLDPAQAVGIGPHRVVDAGKIKREFAAAFLEKMRQQKTHFKKCQGIFSCPHHFVPGVGRQAASSAGWE